MAAPKKLRLLSASFALLVAAMLVCVAQKHVSQIKSIVGHNQEVAILIYETESVQESPALKLAQQAEHLVGVDVSVFGQGQGFEGFGSKYAAVYPILKKMNPKTLVVISDGRDVLINNPVHDASFSASAVQEFRDAYHEIVYSYPRAIIVSAEAQCCVSALTHVFPGGFYNVDGTRNQRACSSGEEDCKWAGDDKAVPWENFMQSLALDRTESSEYEDMYLNAGLIAGTASNLLQVIEAAGIGKDEDDQAVLTDFMYAHPDLIMLDYGQTMFGNNRGGLGGMDEGSCTFGFAIGNTAKESQRLVHSTTGSSPLFLHSPGGFLQCHDNLASKLGLKAVTKQARRRLKQVDRVLQKCNYRSCDDTPDDETGGKTCTKETFQEECSHTAGCKDKYGALATDCWRGGGSVCYCGEDVICGCL